MTSGKFHGLFGGPPRGAEEPLTQRHMDLAASIQKVTEDVVLRLARSIARDTGAKNLCLAGGVALNCVANGKILRDGAFEHIWIQPAAGDAGGAVGAALAVWHVEQGRERRVRRPDGMKGAFLGPSFSQAEIDRAPAAAGAVFGAGPAAEMTARPPAAPAGGKAGGRFQGVSGGNAGAELTQFRFAHQVPQFGLGDEDDLKEFGAGRFQVGQKADLFQQPNPQVLRFIDNQHRPAALGVPVEKVPVEDVHVVLDAGGIALRRVDPQFVAARCPPFRLPMLR